MEDSPIKRQKTVDNLLIQKFAIKDDQSDISNFRDKESVLNITINNIHKVKKNDNFPNIYNRKKKCFKKRRSNNSIFRYINKLYKSEDKEHDGFSNIIKNLIGKNVQNLNININFQQIDQTNSKESVTNHKLKSNTKNLWLKTKNIHKMINALKHPETIKINDEESLRDTLMENNLNKSKNRKSVQNKEITFDQFMRKSSV